MNDSFNYTDALQKALKTDPAFLIWVNARNKKAKAISDIAAAEAKAARLRSKLADIDRELAASRTNVQPENKFLLI